VLALRNCLNARVGQTINVWNYSTKWETVFYYGNNIISFVVNIFGRHSVSADGDVCSYIIMNIHFFLFILLVDE